MKSLLNDLYFVTPMLPYPSGKLHMGHVRCYKVADLEARYRMLKGQRVFCPKKGWDAFGLPAEMAAITHKTPAFLWTKKNIEEMRSALNSLNFYETSVEEENTSNESYQKLEQYIFLKLYEKNLIKQEFAWVNWDPINKTVLANEQIFNGKCWRSNAPVEFKKIKQWFIKITDYAQVLLDDLDELDWPENIKNMQRNWIGKHEGYVIYFKDLNNNNLPVYTTNPSLLEKCSFLLVAEQSLYKDIKECINPLTKEKIPLFIGKQHEINYGTGIAMSNDPIVKNILSRYRNQNFSEFNDYLNFTTINRNEYILENYGNKERKIFYRLHDWCVSRQRYWGCPIPIVFCDQCGPVGDYNCPTLPLSLTTENPLLNKEWYETICPKCKNKATRSQETLDTFLDSSFYMFKYGAPSLLEGESITTFFPKFGYAPVDFYVGGPEHATTHMIYARFITKALYKMGFIKFKEPFKKFVCLGMVCSPYFKSPHEEKYFYPNEVEKKNEKFFVNNLQITKGPFVKMSKSLKNVIEPQEFLDKYGSDTVGFFILSDTPVSQDFNWNSDSIEGCYKFLKRIEKFAKCYQKIELKTKDPFIENLFFEIDENLQSVNYNVYITKLRILFNYMEKKSIYEYFDKYLISLWPAAPVLSNNIYESLFFGNIENQRLYNGEKNHFKSFQILVNSKKVALLETNKKTREEIIAEAKAELEKDEIKKNIENINSMKVFISKNSINFLIS